MRLYHHNYNGADHDLASLGSGQHRKESAGKHKEEEDARRGEGEKSGEEKEGEAPQQRELVMILLFMYRTMFALLFDPPSQAPYTADHTLLAGGVANPNMVFEMGL